MNRADFDQIADELYGGRPDAFIEVRDARVRQARADGNKELARDVAALRRPTQSAWMVNALSRHQRDAVDELLEIADAFNAALAEKAGQRLQELTAQRRVAERNLVKRAEELAGDAGLTPSTDMLDEVRETLDAAVADPGFAAQVRGGRLVKPRQVGGFASAAPVPAPTSGRRGKATKRADSDRPAKSDRVSEQAEREERERELANARENLDSATTELAERTREADEAQHSYSQLGEELEELREQVRQLDKDVAAARQAAAKADRRRVQVQKAHDRARVAFDRAEKEST